MCVTGGSTGSAEAVYSETPSASFYNALACAVMSVLVEDATKTQMAIRVVEIGAGTGATTAGVLPVLDEDHTEYWFTDISDVFLRQAKGKWNKKYPFVKYAILNMEIAPSIQGFAEHSFDCALAVNVLHATRDLNIALVNTRRLLKPGAVLLLSEVTETMETAVSDVTWGLTGKFIYTVLACCQIILCVLADGWWLFDDNRNFAPQSPEQWAQWLEKTGFELLPGATQPDLGGTSSLESQKVMVAFASAEWSQIGRTGKHWTPSQGLQQSILITGGLGGLGLVTAQWVVEVHAAQGLVLTSRTGYVRDKHDQTKLGSLMRTTCANVDSVACDTTLLPSVNALMMQAAVGGLVQSVGVLRDAPLTEQTLSAFYNVTATKLDGASETF